MGQSELDGLSEGRDDERPEVDGPSEGCLLGAVLIEEFSEGIELGSAEMDVDSLGPELVAPETLGLPLGCDVGQLELEGLLSEGRPLGRALTEGYSDGRPLGCDDGRDVGQCDTDGFSLGPSLGGKTPCSLAGWTGSGPRSARTTSPARAGSSSSARRLEPSWDTASGFRKFGACGADVVDDRRSGLIMGVPVLLPRR